ncbi:unnamed protein product [Amoebophrya sp. A25]|nr:unnamed protein product [Amoebophrya sp. A25]|eukprot:GSA25T00018652001.1
MRIEGYEYGLISAAKAVSATSVKLKSRQHSQMRSERHCISCSIVFLCLK